MKDILQWNVSRNLPIKPRHFVQVNIPITKESHIWIEDALVGRYHLAGGLVSESEVLIPYYVNVIYPCFEDPQEALLYELRWA